MLELFIVQTIQRNQNDFWLIIQKWLVIIDHFSIKKNSKYIKMNAYLTSE